MNLEKFKPFNFGEGVPFVSVTLNGLTFNKAVVMKMGFPKFARLLINDEDKMIAVQATDENEDMAVPFYRIHKNKQTSVRWNSRDLLNTISTMMEWNLHMQNFKVEGTFDKSANITVFDLKRAVPLK